VQENAHDYFLSAKARFQKSDDEDDAADLHFACQNLTNHGHDLEWDDVLQKMEDLLKAKTKVKTRRDAVAAGESPPPGGTGFRLTHDKPEDSKDEKKRISAERFFRQGKGKGFGGRKNEVTSISEDEWRKRQEAVPSRRLTVSHPSFPKNRDKVMMEDLPNKLKTFFNLDDYITDIYSSRSKLRTDGKVDEWASLGYFRGTNPEHPKMYQLLRAYYHPESKHYVKLKDPVHDEHEKSIMTKLANEEGRIGPEVDSDDPERRVKIQSIKMRMKRDSGHLSPDVFGTMNPEMRSRLYERGFRQWEEWYDEIYPESPLDEKQKRIVFVDHKAMMMDGCLTSFIQEVLYEEDGSPIVSEEAYLDALKHPEYDSQIELKMQMGDLPHLFGLDMLDSDPKKEESRLGGDMEGYVALEVCFTHVNLDILKSRRYNKPEEWTDSDEENLVALEQTLANVDDNGKALFDTDDNYNVLFDDGTESAKKGGGGGFTAGEFFGYMSRMAFKTVCAIAGHLQSSPYTQDGHIAPTVFGTESEPIEAAFGQAMKEAHKQWDESEEYAYREEGTGRGKSPIQDYIYGMFSDNWNHKHQIPSGFDFSSLTKIEEWLEHWSNPVRQGVKIPERMKQQISNWLDLNSGGAGDYSELFADHSALAQLMAWHYMFPMKPLKSHNFDHKDKDQSHETSVFYPDWQVHGKSGGRDMTSSDVMTVFAKRYPFLFRPVEESMQELSDMRALPKNITTKTVGEDVCKDFGWNPKKIYKDCLGTYMHRALFDKKGGVDIETIRADPTRYGRLSELLNHMTPLPEEDPNIAERPDQDTLAGVDQVPEKEKEPMSLEWLLKHAVREHIGGFLSFDDEAPYVENEDVKGSLRFLRTTPDLSENDYNGHIPITSSIGLMMFSVMNTNKAMRLLQQRHIGFDVNNSVGKKLNWGKGVDEITPPVLPERKRGSPLEGFLHFIRAASLFSKAGLNQIYPERVDTAHPDDVMRNQAGQAEEKGKNKTRLTAGYGKGTDHILRDTGMHTGFSQIHYQAGGGAQPKSNRAASRQARHAFTNALWGIGGEPLKYGDSFDKDSGKLVIMNPDPFLNWKWNEVGVPPEWMNDDISPLMDSTTLWGSFMGVTKNTPTGKLEPRVRRRTHWAERLRMKDDTLKAPPNAYYYPVSRGSDLPEGTPDINPNAYYIQMKPQGSRQTGRRKLIFAPEFYDEVRDSEVREMHKRTSPFNIIYSDNPGLQREARKQPRLSEHASKNPFLNENTKMWEGDEYGKILQGFMENKYLEIDPISVVKLGGKKGNYRAVGEHPSLVMEQWVQNVMREWGEYVSGGRSSPQFDEIEELARPLMDDAEQHALGTLSGYTHDKAGMEQDEAEFTGGTLSLMCAYLSKEVDCFHAMKKTVPLMELNQAFLHRAENPQSYTEADSIVGVLQQWMDNELRLNPADDKAERQAKIKTVHEVRESALEYISQRDPHIRKKISDFLFESEGGLKSFPDDPNGAAWQQYVEDSLNGSDEESIRRTRTVYPSRDYIKIDSLADDRDHPLAKVFHESQGADSLWGHDILKHYIWSKDPRVTEIFESCGMTPEPVEEQLNAILDSVSPSHDRKTNKKIPLTALSSDEQEKVFGKNVKSMRDVGHHYPHEKFPEGNDRESTQPLSWWRRRSEKKFNTRKDTEATLRGGMAKRSSLLWENWERDLKEQISPKDLYRQLAWLTFRNTKKQNLLDVITSDLRAAKGEGRYNTGNLALPEHLNAVTQNESRSLSGNLKNLANFLFLKGRTFKPTSYVIAEPGADRRRLRGYQNEPLEEEEEYDTNYGKAQPYRDRIKAIGSRVSTYLTNTRVGEFFSNKVAGDSTMSAPIDVHPEVTNAMRPDWAGDVDMREERNPKGLDDYSGGVEYKSLDVLTDLDLLYKGEDKDKDKGKPMPIKPMHRIFQLSDLDHFKGFSDDWVVSSWPKGQRLIVSKKGKRITAYNHERDTVSLPNQVREGLRASFDKDYLADAIWTGETLHLVDVLKSGAEDMENSFAKDRIRHLRANFNATEEVAIPAPINTKRVDSEGLERAVKDLFKEKGVKQVLLRDAESTYMRGESRHPKWLLLTPEKQVDAIVLESEGSRHLLGVGPLYDEDAKEIGNRAVKYEGKSYMDVGHINHNDLSPGDFITVKTPAITTLRRNKFPIYTLNGAKYIKDSETGATDSIETLRILAGEKSTHVPHKVRVKKGSIHVELPSCHVVYETDFSGHASMVKGVDAPHEYAWTLAESQKEYWSPLAAVFLRSEVETKKAKKANVVPEPPANHDKTPKKVLKPAERILKDPKITKELVIALEALEGLLKEKITWTGPKALGFDFATPVESPSGPTQLTEPKNLPDHDPEHRQEKGGDCWCGAKKGQICEQGGAHKMENCPEAKPPRKEERKKHIKIAIS